MSRLPRVTLATTNTGHVAVGGGTTITMEEQRSSWSI